MHPRAAWLRAICFALAAFACLSFPAPRRADAAEKEKRVNRQVVRFSAFKEKVQYQGKLVMVLAVEPIGGGRATELVVKNRDMNKREYDPVLNTDNVNALNKGDAIKIELDDSKPRPMVTYLKKYDLKAGEDAPRVYRFLSSYKKGDGPQSYTAVVLSRFDEQLTVALPKPKASKEGPSKEATPDASAEMEDLLGKLQTEEVVEADIKDARPVPVLVSLDRYTPPQTGKFVKLSEQDVAEGQKGQAVEIEQGGKTVTALVPGKLQNKKWVPDAKVMAAARKLKPEADVVYRTRQEGEKVWLKEIEPAPKQQREKLTARDRDRDGNMDKANDRGAARDRDGAGDAGERRGRRPRNDK